MPSWAVRAKNTLHTHTYTHIHGTDALTRLGFGSFRQGEQLRKFGFQPSRQRLENKIHPVSDQYEHTTNFNFIENPTGKSCFIFNAIMHTRTATRLARDTLFCCTSMFTAVARAVLFDFDMWRVGIVCDLLGQCSTRSPCQGPGSPLHSSITAYSLTPKLSEE